MVNLLAIAFILGSVLLVLRAARRLQQRQSDPLIDGLIAHAGARWRPGMERVDWAKVDCVGKERWDQTVKAHAKAHVNGHMLSFAPAERTRSDASTGNWTGTPAA